MGADLIWPPGVVASNVIVPLNIKCSVNNARGGVTRTAFVPILFEAVPSFSIVG